MNYISELKRTVIDNGYCIGSGACSFTSNGKLDIKKNDICQIEAVISNIESGDTNYNVLDICPFYNKDYNEDATGKELYSELNDIKHDEYIG